MEVSLAAIVGVMSAVGAAIMSLGGMVWSLSTKLTRLDLTNEDLLRRATSAESKIDAIEKKPAPLPVALTIDLEREPKFMELRRDCRELKSQLDRLEGLTYRKFEENDEAFEAHLREQGDLWKTTTSTLARIEGRLDGWSEQRPRPGSRGTSRP